MWSTKVTKHVTSCNSEGSSAQWLKWQPLLQRGSTVMCWFVASIMNILIIVVGEIVQRTVDMLCRTLNPTNHTANRNLAWLVDHGRQSSELWFHFQFQEIWKGDCACCRTAKNSSVKNRMLQWYFLSNFAVEDIFTHFSQVSSERKKTFCLKSTSTPYSL